MVQLRLTPPAWLAPNRDGILVSTAWHYRPEHDRQDALDRLSTLVGRAVERPTPCRRRSGRPAHPATAAPGLLAIVETLRGLERRIEIVDKQIPAWGRNNQTSRQLITIPGYGPIQSSAMAAMVVNPAAVTSGRHFSASLGLVPRRDGTGGKVKLGPISKRGNGYLRRLLVSGAMSVLCSKRAQQDPWLAKLLETKSAKSLPASSCLGTVLTVARLIRRPRIGSSASATLRTDSPSTKQARIMRSSCAARRA